MTGPGYPANPPYVGGPDEVVPVGGLSATGIAALAAKTAQDWEDELYGTADTFLTPISDLLGKLFDLFAEFVDIDGFVEIASDVLGFFYNLLDRAGFFTLLEGTVAFFGWLTELGVDAIEALLKPLIEFLTGLWNFVVALISGEDLQDLIEQVVNFLGGFLSGQNFVDLFQTIVQFFAGLFTDAEGFTASVTAFINNLPLIGPIVAAITGKTEADGVALDLSTLSAYFRGLDKQVTDGVAGLIAAAGKFLGGTVSVSQVSNTEQNLLSQGDFLTSSTVDPAGGWSWDSTRTRTGSGGSLKATCIGSSQRIYCRQDIKVAAGDRLVLSGYVGTNSFTSGSMQLSLQPWAPSGGVMTAQTVVNGTARTTAANTFQALPVLNYTVPAGVTSVQVSLVVNCNSGAEVFFDDIVLKKTGVLGQGLVSNLIDAFNGILAGAGYVFGTGWEFLQTAVGLVTGTANDAFNNTEDTNTVLFNNPDGGTTIVPEALDIPGIGGQINPTSGSGAMMVRTSASAVTCSAGRNLAPPNFFDSVALSGSGITSTTSTGTFQVSQTGWYMVEICYRINIAFGTGAFRVTPVLYRNGADYKVGSEAGFTWLGSTQVDQRYVQNSFIVYLTANQTVQAGADIAFAGGASSGLGGGAGAAENYFSISLLNKTYT